MSPIIFYLGLVLQDKNVEMVANKYYPIYKQIIETKNLKLMELSIFTIQVLLSPKIN